MKCPHCGASIYDDINRCQYCGSYIDRKTGAAVGGQQVVVNVYTQSESHRQPEPRPQTTYVRHCSHKSRAIALLLCLFFGVIGVHKFYLGRVGLGILYLLTGGLFGIGIFVDVLVLLLGSPRDGYGQPLLWRQTD